MYTTYCDCYNNTCSHAEETLTETAHSHEDYNVGGHFDYAKYTARQECDVQNKTFAEAGSKDCDFSSLDMSNNFECCECKPWFGRAAGTLDENCLCEDSCVHSRHVADPDADIDRRIEESVEKAISDILSGMVHRCISDSLKNCI